MPKYFLISFDDGSIYDPKLVRLLNDLNLKGTFNLNSGLEDFTWNYREDFVVRRQKLSETVELYRGHEVASHSLHHPRLDTLTPPQLRREVEEDCAAIKEIFGLRKIGFGVPFTVCGEREVRILQKHVAYIRLSEYAKDFSLPADPYHIPIHALYNDPDVKAKLAAFAAEDREDGLFVLAGHSYELEAENHWDYFRDLLTYARSLNLTNTTTMAFVEAVYPGK